MVFPYLGGPTVEGHGRVLRVKERPAQGWHVFRVVGRNAWPVEPTSPPDEAVAQTIRGHHYGGYLFGPDGFVAELELTEGEQEIFAPCKAYRWSTNDLIFAGVDFEGEAEGAAREALEELRPLSTVRGVPATLRLAYGFAVLHRRARQLDTTVAPVEVANRMVAVAEIGVRQANDVLQRILQERALAAARVEQQRAMASARASQAQVLAAAGVGPGAPAAGSAPPPGTPLVAYPVNQTPQPAPQPPQPQLSEAQQVRVNRRLRENERQQRMQAPRMAGPAATAQNAGERAEEVLEAAGAKPVSTRLLDSERLQVHYRFMNQRFVTVVHPITLQVIDAGICLAGSDRMVTLDSLPSVIREAIQTSKLVITRHW